MPRGLSNTMGERAILAVGAGGIVRPLSSRDVNDVGGVDYEGSPRAHSTPIATSSSIETATPSTSSSSIEAATRSTTEAIPVLGGPTQGKRGISLRAGTQVAKVQTCLK